MIRSRNCSCKCSEYLECHYYYENFYYLKIYKEQTLMLFFSSPSQSFTRFGVPEYEHVWSCLLLYYYYCLEFHSGYNHFGMHIALDYFYWNIFNLSLFSTTEWHSEYRSRLTRSNRHVIYLSNINSVGLVPVAAFRDFL